ncbi:toprim domain-containing protein [Nocardioides sp. YR527]|uniref:toprim domain-containing protein n=1 Tax=Nocardioides sp. YR527 TaxID=1881028 RepID=UPI000B81B7C1|nr:toprim domain-containing protein [Nocardioides sp. YR527]
MSDEFEVGHEMDRALRAAVTGLAQIMERTARRSADESRAAAAEARQEWLAHRDAARQQYVPWLQPGAVEKTDGRQASRVWAVAAGWSTMDPLAKAAEEQLADRIKQAFGEHPSVLVQQTDLAALPEQTQVPTVLTMQEALGLAQEHAPFYYRAHTDLTPRDQLSPAGDLPSSPAEERVLADWQTYAQTGALPDRSRWEAWAAYTGRADDFDPEQWRTTTGELDHESRDAALERLWDEGSEERGLRDLEEHQVAMTAAGMGQLRTQVAAAPPAADPEQVPAWVRLVDEREFSAASQQEISQAWRDARSRAASGDLAAQAAATQLSEQIRKKHGINPDEYVIGALTERAANNAENARKAADKARRAQEAAQPITPTRVIPGPTQEQGRSTSPAPQVTVPGEAYATAPLTRERVLELNRVAQDYFSGNMRPGTTGQRYFVDRLGEGVVDGPWALGYAPPGWTNLTNHLKGHGASDEEILAAGLGRRSSKGNVIDYFRDRAMIGVRDRDGDVVGFVGRDLSGDQRAPKYTNSPTTAAFTKSEHVFGLAEAPEGARIVRTEGAFDAIATSLAGDGEAAGVAPMGTAMSATQASQIANRAVDGRVWLANDNDAAGQMATEQDYFALAQQGAQARHVVVPEGDPAEAWQHYPGLMRSTMSTLDDAPSAAEVVVDRYLMTNGEALASRDRDARSGLNDLVARVTATLDDPIEARLLAEEAERRRRELVDQAATAQASSTKTNEVVSADPTEGRDGRPPHVEERLGEHSHSTSEPTQPYNRADSSDLTNVSPQAREARVGSGHGFAMSTKDAIEQAANGHKGLAARPDRGGQAPRRGRSRSK